MDEFMIKIYDLSNNNKFIMLVSVTLLARALFSII